MVPWSGGCWGQSGDLVPGGESGGHFLSVLGCGESVASRSDQGAGAIVSQPHSPRFWADVPSGGRGAAFGAESAFGAEQRSAVAATQVAGQQQGGAAAPDPFRCRPTPDEHRNPTHNVTDQQRNSFLDASPRGPDGRTVEGERRVVE